MQSTTSSITEVFNKRFTLINISFAFLLLFVLFIPASKPISTVGEVGAIVLLLIALFASPSGKSIQSNLRKNKSIFLLSFFFLFYVIGLIYTQDLQQGLSELNKKHYFLSVPFILACFNWNRQMLLELFSTFVLANVVVAILILLMEFGNIYLFRAIEGDISPFVQRPRASLFLAVSLLLIPEMLQSALAGKRNIRKYLLYGAALLLITALFLFKGRIGLLCFVLLMPFGLYHYKQKVLLFFFVVAAIGAIFISQRQNKLTGPIVEAIAEIKDWQLGYLEGDPAQSSMGQRLDYHGVFFKVFEKNPLIGVGSGDLMLEALPVFEEMEIVVRPDRPHNQFLDVGVRFGFIGLFLFLLLIYRIYQKIEAPYKALGRMILCAVLLSMLFDDTLETQAGISFAVFFMGIFLLNYSDKNVMEESSNELIKTD